MRKIVIGGDSLKMAAFKRSIALAWVSIETTIATGPFVG